MPHLLIEKVLAIETSCDDTSTAIVDHLGNVITLLSANQDLVHAPFGGIVPEIASRNHTQTLLPLIEETFIKSKLSWSDIGGLAVTSEPGLLGSLLVGVVVAKTLALTRKLPLIGVNHLEGHLMAPFLRDQLRDPLGYAPPSDFSFPFIALAVSGGHSNLYQVNGLGEYTILGGSIDDAAGEAFDKFAKAVGLGFPGGAKVDQWAREGQRDAFAFPRALMQKGDLRFSFSGLKTAAQKVVESMDPLEVNKRRADLCASFQEAVVEVLVEKLARVVKMTGIKKVVVTGGVSANSRLREAAAGWAQREGLQLVIPPLKYCTDNAAMIGYAGIQRLNRGERSDLELSPSASSTIV